MHPAFAVFLMCLVPGATYVGVVVASVWAGMPWWGTLIVIIFGGLAIFPSEFNAGN